MACRSCVHEQENSGGRDVKREKIEAVKRAYEERKDRSVWYRKGKVR